MTQRVSRRKLPETVEAKYNRLNKRCVRRLAMTAAETRWLWNEKGRRMREREIANRERRMAEDAA
jgi:hypothetical protein